MNILNEIMLNHCPTCGKEIKWYKLCCNKKCNKIYKENHNKIVKLLNGVSQK
jgi:predicted nucleic acid-binding Zn ribbon protein